MQKMNKMMEILSTVRAIFQQVFTLGFITHKQSYPIVTNQ